MGGLFLGVKLAGAFYLIWLGYRYWTAPVAQAWAGEVPRKQGFISQLMLTLGNPKSLMFWLALMPTVIDLRKLNGVGYAQLVAATLVVIPAIELAYAAQASRIRTLFNDMAARRRMNKGAAAIMIGAGIGVAVT
jgi:threonine/homoserine/homoserine lactone efflux protein